MIIIRLSRGGSKKRPFYHIVVTDSRQPRDGRYIERLGYYNPVASGKELPLSLEKARIDYWVTQGAKLSPTVTRLVKKSVKEALNDLGSPAAVAG
jgi:small subunit ribosomal protein S16